MAKLQRIRQFDFLLTVYYSFFLVSSRSGGQTQPENLHDVRDAAHFGYAIRTIIWTTTY